METQEQIAAQRRANKDHQQATPASRAPFPSHYTLKYPDVNTIIGGVLQGGAILSSAVIVAGLLLFLLQPGALSSRALQVFPHTLNQIWAGLLVLQPQAVIAAGLVLLIATPVMRVSVSILAFAVEHDRLYVLITLVVLAILCTSFLLGKAGA